MCLPQISCTAILLAELLHACKIQLLRRGAAKNRYRDFQPAVVVVDLFHASIEIRKRPVHDTHLLVALKNHLGLRSEERRVGKERRSRWMPYHYKKNTNRTID